MTDAERAVWLTYLRDLADRMLLRDWTITLAPDDADHESYAQINVRRDKNAARVWLSDGWRAFTPELQRETVVHELLHCHVDRMSQVMSRLTEQLDSDVAKLAQTMFGDESEIATDALARLLAPFMPLPEGGG